MRTTSTLAVACLAVFAVACGKSDADRAADSAAAAAAAAAATPAAPAPAPAPAVDEPTVIAIFDAANQADIETGGLAVRKGSTKAVRDFGAMLERDHKGVQQQGRDLAQKLNVTPTPPADTSMMTAHYAAMASLQGKSGADFDRAFLENEVAYHQGVIDAVNNTLMPAIRNQELKELVTKVAPAFVAHKEAAQALLDKMPKA